MSDDAMVPKARLDAALAKQAELQARLDAAGDRISAAESAAADARKAAKAAEKRISEVESDQDSAASLRTQLTEARAQLESERQSREQDRIIASAGFDDPDLVRFEASRAGATDLAQWIEQIRSDRESAPASLRPYLPEPEATDQTAADAEAATQATQRGTAARAGHTASVAPTAVGATLNDRIRAIPHPVGTAEYMAAARSILRGGDPS